MNGLRKRLLAKVVLDHMTGCILWTGYISPKGYGAIRIGPKMAQAHRAAWILANGEIPAGMHVLHKCDVRNCINTDHLFLGTPKDNSQDRQNKKRGRDQNGSKHNFAKLNE